MHLSKSTYQYEMVYESFSSGKSFWPQLDRGRWQKPTDFVYASLGLMLKIDLYFLFTENQSAIVTITGYLVCLVFYMLPFTVINSFLGQFSSSGCISALRISPIFKGVGYACIVSVLHILITRSISVALPMIFLINSFRPTLSWSCEVWRNWAQNLTRAQRLTICNFISKNATAASANETKYFVLHIPSELYFKQNFENTDFDKFHIGEMEFSWIMIVVVLLVWAIIGYVFYACSEITKFGALTRYVVRLIFVLILLSFWALLQLSGSLKTFERFLSLEELNWDFSPTSIILMAMRTFGDVWGPLIALSSFNQFKADIMRYSWMIGLGQMLIVFYPSLMDLMIFSHFQQHEETDNVFMIYKYRWSLELTGGSALASLKWPNLWSIIFYSMMTLSNLTMMCVRLFTILQSLFDEFEPLRLHKKEVTFGLIGCLALISVYYFSSKHIRETAFHFDFNSTLIRSLLHALLILAMLWLYGYERLKRDMEFMLNLSLSTWKLNVARVLGIIVIMLTIYRLYYFQIVFGIYNHFIQAVSLSLMPILLIPGMVLYRAYKQSGNFCNHLKDACKPCDWHPIDGSERRRYEDLVVSSHELPQQLTNNAPELVL